MRKTDEEIRSDIAKILDASKGKLEDRLVTYVKMMRNEHVANREGAHISVEDGEPQRTLTP